MISIFKPRIKAVVINKEEKGIWGVLSRPGKLVMKDKITTKGVVLGAMALAAAGAYLGVRAMRNRDSDEQPESFTARIEQQRAAAAAADQSAARG